MSGNDAFGSYESYEPSDSAKAFAAYEAAWAERERTGDVGEHHLVDALREREVPETRWRRETDLGRTLFDAWHAGRPPNRLHGTILKYRWRRLKSVPNQLRGFFRDGAPEHLGVPKHLAKISMFNDDAELELEPTATFPSLMAHWWDQFDLDHVDGDARTFPVWLDSGQDPRRVPVMVATEIIGHTEIPTWAADALLTATKRRKRAVAHGFLEVERVEGQFEVEAMEVWLPADPDDD